MGAHGQAALVELGLWHGPDQLGIGQPPMTEVAALLPDAIANVQAGIDRFGWTRGQRFDEGLEQLDTLHGLLGTTNYPGVGTREILADNDSPKIDLVIGALRSVVASTKPDIDARLQLADAWTVAASSGRGRITPVRLVAQIIAVSTVKDMANEEPLTRHFDNMMARVLRDRYNPGRRLLTASGLVAAGTVIGRRHREN